MAKAKARKKKSVAAQRTSSKRTSSKRTSSKATPSKRASSKATPSKRPPPKRTQRLAAAPPPPPPPPPELVVAIPKGRVLKTLAERFARAGVDPAVLLADDRTLVRDDPRSGLRFLLLKPDDVPTYVEYGSADVGVVGRDILMEREYDLYAPLDLGIGRCRLAVCGKPEDKGRIRRSSAAPLRVATKFATLTRRHYLSRGEQVDIVYVQGSVELAPILGLSDVIVDLVESGETLRQNGLVEHETICEISSVIIANRVALKLKRERITRLLEALALH